jgi:F-type H+-transporting ATPase subunit a
VKNFTSWQFQPSVQNTKKFRVLVSPFPMLKSKSVFKLFLSLALLLACPVVFQADDDKALTAAQGALSAASSALKAAEKAIEAANEAMATDEEVSSEVAESHDADGGVHAEEAGAEGEDHHGEDAEGAQGEEHSAGEHVEGEAHGDEHEEGGHGNGEDGEAHHGLSMYAPPVFEIAGFQVTNSMIVVIIVAVLLILVAQAATKNMERVPNSKLQNFVEWFVEGIYGLVDSVLGTELTKKTFWFFGTLFIFILATNWFGLIPGIGTVGWNVVLPDGAHEFRPFLRGANADLNMTAAMAFSFAVMWFVWAIQAQGFKGFLLHIFGPKGEYSGFMKYLMIGIFLFLGLIETVSILMRPIALQFRLYGNVFAGENILEAMLAKGFILGSLVPIPFYFLEILVGLVQAVVFLLLTTVFTALICERHDEGDHEVAH